MRAPAIAGVMAGLTLATATSAAAQIVDSGVPGMVFEHNVAIPMTDGVQLKGNLYRPEAPGRYPVIMLMGPYGKDTHYKDHPIYRFSWKKLTEKYPNLCAQSSCRYMRWEAPDPERWVKDGYAVMHIDSRGSGASPGMLDPFSPREAEDYSTAITWASRQPWSSGKVGLLGTSYYGINQWVVAARQPEGLAAMIPWEGAFDPYREIGFDGGIIATSWKNWWNNTVVVNQHGNGASPLVDSILGGRSTGEALPPDLLKLNRVPIVDTFAAYPLDGAYWSQRRPDPSRVVVPFRAAANWQGWSTLGFEVAASPSKWLSIHAGDHLTPFYDETEIAEQKRFFAHYLKGEDNGWEKEPPVSLAVRRPGVGVTWRKETSWPLQGTKWERYYLDAAQGTLTPGKNGAAAEKTYPAKGDGLTLKTAPFAKETEFTGPITLKTWVRSTTADMDLFATLRLIDPQGRDVTFVGGLSSGFPLSSGALRVSHRALDPARSRENQPVHAHRTVEPMTPGQIYPVDVNIRGVSIVVPKGYRLAVTLQGKDWNGTTVESVSAKDYDFPEEKGSMLMFQAPGHEGRDAPIYGGENTIVTGGEHASYLLLPNIPTKR